MSALKYKYIKWFQELHKDDTAIAGGKGANLGELTGAGIPVLPGFVVTAGAYFDFIEKTSLKHKIVSELKGLDCEDSKALQGASLRIRRAILAAELPEDIKQEVVTAYKELCGSHDQQVAVRSSATAEDLPDASFAGQQETFLNTLGEKAVLKALLNCYASLFHARAIYYRESQKYDHFKVGLASPVQIMGQFEVAGIMFTADPMSSDENQIDIEAAFGLAEPVVLGELTPDQYLVQKKPLKILNKIIVKQEWQRAYVGKLNVSKGYQRKQKLTDAKILELSRLGIKINEHYKQPQDTEWGVMHGKIYFVQSRPITTLGKTLKTSEDTASEIDPKAVVLLEGSAASPGVGAGKVRIIHKASEITKVRPGEILVTEMTDPDFVPAMKRAVAIVTNEGGRTSHAAIVSRELGIPCIVGTSLATKLLKTGEEITVDGSSGKVYEGIYNVQERVSTSQWGDPTNVKTATKVYVNLAEPDEADRIAGRYVDGVGLLRAELMIAGIGTHPRKLIEDGKGHEFTNKLAEGIAAFAKAFGDRPVIYRATDFKTNEYRDLKGGAKYEPEERNPMIGFRGVSRYIKDADVFELELAAIAKVRNKLGYKNVHLMLPFIRTVKELEEVKRIISAAGLRRSGSFKIEIMVEVPSAVILLEDMIDCGIDGVSIGSNDLTMLLLGCDRDNELVANIYDERNPAVTWALEKIVKTCAKKKVTCSICGQAPSDYPDLTRKLVEWGITSVSINPDVIEKTRQIVHDAELDLVHKRTRH